MSPAYWTARALTSAFGTELYSGFDRGYDVGAVFRLGRWRLAKANCVYVPCFIKWSLLYGGTF